MDPAIRRTLSDAQVDRPGDQFPVRAAGASRRTCCVALAALMCLYLACAGPHVPAEPVESDTSHVTADVARDEAGIESPPAQGDSLFLLTSYEDDPPTHSVLLEEGVRTLDASAEPMGAELGVPADQFSDQGFRLLDTTLSSGRFPTGVAVARIGLPRNAGGGGRLQLERMCGVEAVPWNELLDDVPVVRETLLSGPVGLTPGAPAIVEIVRAAGHLRCGLCLTYVAWGDGKTSYGLKGVLWETLDGAPLATIRACDEVAIEDYEACIEEQEGDIDERPCRADTRAIEQFHQSVVAALIELIRQDRPATATQPSPWRGNLPLYPRDNRPIIVTPRDRSEPQ